MPISLGSVTNLPVIKAGRSAPVLVGDETRAFAGNARTSVRAQKRIWNVTVGHIDTPTEGSVQTAIANAAQITVSGDITALANVTASVHCTSSDMVVGTTLWDVQLVISEV